jgi:hypothetical protein
MNLKTFSLTYQNLQLQKQASSSSGITMSGLSGLGSLKEAQ